MRSHALIWIAVAAGAVFGSVASASCPLGVKSCRESKQRPARATKPAKVNVAVAQTVSTTTEAGQCTVPGAWVITLPPEYEIPDYQISVSQDLTGTLLQPLCGQPHSLTVTLQSPTSFVARAVVAPGSEICVSATMDLTFAPDCKTASGTWVNDGDEWQGELTWERVPPTWGLHAAPPTIPSESRVQQKKVLTESDITITTILNGQPAAGLVATLESNRPADDTITGPSAPTDAAGQTTAKVSTRAQPGPSTIGLASPTDAGDSHVEITWLPASYESSFLVTCYVVSIESDFSGTALIGPVRGLPAEKTYRSGFIADVRLQGSGVATDGTTIHYDGGGRYSVQSCPLTSTGACAVDGTTAAVDYSVIPRRSTISIADVGTRIAQDTGQAITGYHIDEYFGTRRAECKSAGRRTLHVDFIGY